MPDTDRLINKAQGDDIITALNGITSRLQEMYTVDDALSSTSEHPVQNKVVKAALDDKADESDLADKADKSDIASTQTISGNPITLTDAAPINAESLVVELQPKQDLHGQSAPYVGGAGKNKLPMTIDGIKAANTSGTWNGNVYSINNGTFTVNTDNGGNVTGIVVNGAFNANIDFSLNPNTDYLSSNDTMILNGCPAGGNFETSYSLVLYSTSSGGGYPMADKDTGNGAQNTEPFINGMVAIKIVSGYTASNLVFYPMIRLATESDSTFAPYSNICPITGYDEVVVDDVGKNLLNIDAVSYPYTDSNSNVQVSKNTDGSINLNGTATGEFLYPEYPPNQDFYKDLKPSTNYIASIGITTSDIIIQVYYRETSSSQWTLLSEAQGSLSFTTPNAYYDIWIRYRAANGTSFSNLTIYPMVRLATVTDSNFEPYQSNQVKLQIGNKNKLPMTVDGIKAANTDGTWTGNAYAINGVTFTINTDTDGNVTSLKVNGTASATIFFKLCDFPVCLTDGTSYKINGNASGYDSSTAYMQVQTSNGGGVANVGSEYTLAYTSGGTVQRLIIRIDTSGNPSNLVFYPMIRLATESDSTFAPYSNICPITGYTQTSVEGCGDNRLDYDDWKQSTIANGTGTWENNGVTLTATANDCFTYSSDYEKGEVSVNNGDSVKISWEENTNANGTIYAFDQNGNILGATNNNASKALNVTIGSGVSKIRFRFGVDASGVTIAYKNIMVQVNTNESTYSPYASTSATIQFGQTVYGGKSNFTEGGTDVGKTKVKISDLTPYGHYNGTNATCSSFSLSDNANSVQYNQTHGAITDRMTEAAAYYGWHHENEEMLAMPFFSISTDGTLLSLYDEDTTLSQSDFLAKYGDTEICYPKATPTTIQTPPTDLKLLKGTNNLSADGVMQIGYQPDNVIGDVKGEIEAIDNSWKNILPMTKEGIKFSNTLTWTDDVTFKLSNNVTGTLLMEGGDITGIHVVSTGSNDEFFYLCPEGVDYSRFSGCILSGCDVGDDSKIFIAVRNYSNYAYYAKHTSGETVIDDIPTGQRVNIYVYFPAGGTVDTIIRPMIRKGGNNTYTPPKPSTELLMDLIAYLFTQI